VIEHLDEPRFAAFELMLFGDARPERIIITTPNAEYNVRFATLPAGQFRHKDHRFEWGRGQFQSWANATAQKFGYQVEFAPSVMKIRWWARPRRWESSADEDHHP
jgi:hypothetical protein